MADEARDVIAKALLHKYLYAVASEDISDDILAALSAAGLAVVDTNVCPSGQFSNPSLSDAVVEAGMAAKESADHDLANYVSGETIDWDTGMICVAIFQAMLKAYLAARGPL
jgi:hypothetical protein